MTDYLTELALALMPAFGNLTGAACFTARSARRFTLLRES